MPKYRTHSLVVLVSLQLLACSSVHSRRMKTPGSGLIGAFKQVVEEGCLDSKGLVSVTQAYRRKNKVWPTSKEELMSFWVSNRADLPLVNWDEYSNVIFSPLPDGGLATKYDALIPVSFDPGKNMPIKEDFRIDPVEDLRCGPEGK